MLNTSVLTMFSKLKLKKRTKEAKHEEESDNEEEAADKRIVISSIDELTNKKEDNIQGKETDDDIPIKTGNEKNDSEKVQEVVKNTDYKLPSLNLLKTVKNVNSK